MLVRKRLRLTGRVQGVAFRASTVMTARALGLAGWVANRADGSVEAVAEGDEAGIAAFIRWCHQGPPAARDDATPLRYPRRYGSLHTDGPWLPIESRAMGTKSGRTGRRGTAGGA